MRAAINNLDFDKKKIEHFTDLDVWKLGRELLKDVYEITKRYPQDELYGLVSQIRRATISVTSNIAEGMGRYSYRERIRFLYNSRGSLFEIENLLYLSADLEYLNQDKFVALLGKVERTRKILNAFITSTEKLLKSYE